MCTTHEIRYLHCKREGYGTCVAVNFRRCKKAEESGEACAVTTTRAVWIEYKCMEHGGPAPDKRAQMMREKGLQGRERQVVVQKGDRGSEWKGALCVVS